MGIVDKRLSVELGIRISIQIITVTLALMALLGGLITYFRTNYCIDFWFYFFTIISFLLLFASIFKAGKGINVARKQGFNSDWALDHTKNEFNWQAIFCILGFLMIIILFIIPQTPKEDQLSKTIQLLEKNLNQYKDQSLMNSQMQQELLIIKNEIDSLKMVISKKDID